MQTFTGIEYLKIDIANNFGLDKKNWDERIEWFDKNREKLPQMLNQADNPALFFAGLQAMEAAEAGKPSGYPISLDATASGMQLLAVMTGDRRAAELCNVINVKKDGAPQRQDGYTVVYKAMVDAIGEEGRISREDTKSAIMTSLYGSIAEPKKVFGEGILLQIFYSTMKKLAPAVWELNEAFLDMWDSEALMNSWVLPDNFHVHIKVMDRVTETVHFMNAPYEVHRMVNAPIEEGRSLGANTTHSVDGMVVREMGRRCDYNRVRVETLRQDIECLDAGYTISMLIDDDADAEMVRTLWDHYEESGFLSARILDHLYMHNLHLVDRAVIKELIESLPAKPFKVVAVHDCFRCLPNYGNDLRKQYTNLLQLIGKSNLLQFLISQILKRKVAIGKLDEDMWKEIGDAEYALS